MKPEIEIHRGVWLKRNKELAEKMENYCAEYRKRKCQKCNKNMRKMRNCRVYPSGKRYCDIMMDSRVRAFKETVSREIKLLIDIEYGDLPLWSKK